MSQAKHSQVTISSMTRSDLIDELAERFRQLTKGDTELAVNAILDALSNALVQGKHIEIRGFGSFSVAHRAARIGRNPRSGESVAVPEKRVVHFKPGKSLRESAGRSESTARMNAGIKPINP